MVSAGVGFSGAGAAQPFIQQLIAQQRQKQQQAALAQALQKYAAQNGQGQQPGGPPPNGGQQPGTPPQLPPGIAPGAPPTGVPSGSAMPTGQPPAPGASPPRPGASPMPLGAPLPGAGLPQQGSGQGFAGGMPDLGTMIGMLSKSGLSPDQQYAALKDYGAFASPYEKMMQQLELKQTQMSFQSQMLSERLQSMRDIAAARNSTSRANAGTRADTAATTRDVGTIEKELSDQRSYMNTILSQPKGIDSPEYKEAKQDYETLRRELEDSRKGKTSAPQKSPKTAPAAGPTAGASGGTAETVSVISPDGTPGTIPAAQLQDALKAGYKQAQ